MRPLKLFLTTSILLTVFAASNINAQDMDEVDMLDMSLEDLMNMEVTSVSKKAERLQDVASSIYVLSSDEIAKSGATTLHEALRNVPGYWGVQDAYSSVYASIRNSPAPNTFPGTVLYLLDGTPIQELMSSEFSFHNFDIPLDEIDRIEVIRGSGGTVYGANSATGVVNIFTKNPEKYDGINVKAEGAAPGYAVASVRAGGQISEKLAISGYAKYRYFSGWESMTGKDEDGNTVNSNPTLVNDTDKSNYYSLGAKLNFNISEKSKISARVHFNGYQKDVYTSVYDDQFIITRDDILKETNVNANRLVANLRFDQSFSDTHSLFFRVSTNVENDFYRIAGGMNVSNSIIDFELQDNISLGQFNDLSFGANYRIVNFDIYDISSTDYVNYIDPQSTESISGIFVQDKIKLLDEKLNLILGVKAENYSLVNDEYYLSPMAKVSYIANKNITLWGGYTQSYTTPGFNNTNVDLFLFQTPNQATWTNIVTKGVYDGAYQQAIDGGADDATADAIATGYISSTEGEAVIAAGVQENSLPNIAAKNGSETVPTKFQTLEIGFKTSFGDKLQFNSTFFKTHIEDGVAVNPIDPLPTEIGQPSITNPSRITDYYLYGNYVKGESIGSETMIRFFPIKSLTLEASHSWTKTEWEFQENNDFNVDDFKGVKVNGGSSYIPEHIFRFKANYDFDNGLNIAASLIQTSKYRTNAYYFYQTERYETLVENEFPSGSEESNLIAKDDSRTIVNLRIEKAFVSDKLSVYIFGNDITNTGIVADTDVLKNTTLNQIGAMYGAGLNYKFK